MATAVLSPGENLTRSPINVGIVCGEPRIAQDERMLWGLENMKTDHLSVGVREKESQRLSAVSNFTYDPSIQGAGLERQIEWQHPQTKTTNETNIH